MYAAAFTLDLYCENQPSTSGTAWVNSESPDGIHIWNEFPHQFVAWDRAHAFRKARKKGWLINKARGTCLCPKCSGKKTEAT